MNDHQREKRKGIPRKYRTLYDRAVDSTSRKAAIRSFCLECCGWNEKETRLCTAKGCPLYKYRKKG